MAGTPVGRVVRRRPNALARDLAAIEGGIALVESGHAQRVVLCELRFAERLLARSVELGRRVGVDVRLDRHDRGSVAAIVVSRPDR